MLFGKKKNAEPEKKELYDIRDAKPSINDSDLNKLSDDLEIAANDIQSVIRPISFEIEDNAPNMIKAMNTNQFAADPFMLTVGNAKLVLDIFYNIAKAQANSTNPVRVYPSSDMTACNVFAQFMLSEYYNVISTSLCTRMLSDVNKPLALYLLDKLNDDKLNTEILFGLKQAVTEYEYRYKTTREERGDIALTYYSEFNNAMFMALYSHTIDKISLTIDMDSKALMYMLDDSATREIYHILDDESLAYLKSNPRYNIVAIRNCYKAIIQKDLNDTFMVFPDIVSKASSMLEKYCFDTKIKISKINEDIPYDPIQDI